MNVMVLRANARTCGYTAALTDLFVKGLRAGGAAVDEARLAELDLRHCTGCYHCWLVTPGVCIHRDDMPGLIERLRGADIAVFCSPLNSYGVSSHLKVFMDRTLACTKEGFATTRAGLVRNANRDPARWPRRLAYLLVGAFKPVRTFEAAVRTMELYADGIDCECAGGIVRPESYLLPFRFAKPRTVKTIETAIEQAGYELASAGSFDPGTIARAQSPLSSDIDHFQRYANIFWEHARRMGAAALDLDAVRAAVESDARVLMSEMARSCDPLATARLRAVFQFDFPDRELHFRITVRDGAAAIEQAASERCDLRVTVSSDTWAKVFKREISARDALVDGRIRLTGDKALFSRLDRYFPPPSM